MARPSAGGTTGIRTTRSPARGRDGAGSPWLPARPRKPICKSGHFGNDLKSPPPRNARACTHLIGGMAFVVLRGGESGTVSKKSSGLMLITVGPAGKEAVIKLGARTGMVVIPAFARP